MSPEIACSRRFAQYVLQDQHFRQKNLYIVIDEVHVVDQWSTFRKEYGKLGQFRSRLPPSTRALGVSATLDPATRAAVTEKGGIRNPIFINITTDRPEIYIEFRATKSTTSFENLHFLFPDELTLSDAAELPKVIIYFDSKQDIRLALEVCRDWLVNAGLHPRDARKIVGAYYASLRETEKKRIRNDFKYAHSPCRIMLVTEAMGMGVEMEGIAMVVQYGSTMILKEVGLLKSLVQRMGRAARGAGESGHFIWLVKDWFFCPPAQEHGVPPGRSSRL